MPESGDGWDPPGHAPTDSDAPRPSGKIPEPTLVRFRKARKAFEEAETGTSPGLLEGSSYQQRFRLEGPAPPPARRSLFRRILITTLAVLAIYGGLTQLLAYRLGANVLSDSFQRQLIMPALVAIEDSVAHRLGSGTTPEELQSFLDQKYGQFQRLSISIYSAEGALLAERGGTPGTGPSELSDAYLRQISKHGQLRDSVGLGFVAVSTIHGVEAGTGEPVGTIGYLRVAAQPSTASTRRLIWEASWRWAFPVFLLSVLMAFLGTRSITQRLREAEQTVGRMKEGDMSARIPVSEMDELGQVATTFNQTADLLQRTVQELEETDETRRRLVADFAHELNTPLTNVLAYLETLIMAEEEGGMDQQSRIGFLKVAHDEAHRLAHLARDLETLTKLEAGNLVMERQLVDISRLAVELARRVIPRAERQQLEVFTDIEPGGEVVGDQMRLEQVGMNLLENALRYTQEGSLTISVACTELGVT
ncbi:MAG: HAMP domain-containing sensor histidine kinase, partial [Myxococcota bacterium]|nr:HAMP domain-containing sensor histidine kinase [Myxococcota bacterium]